MHRSITLKPVFYVSLFICAILPIGYLLFSHHDPFYRWPKPPVFYLPRKIISYKTVHELLNDVAKYQAASEYQNVIDILRSADIDKLVSSELDKDVPSVVTIDGISRFAFGIENHREVYEKYHLVSFPNTGCVITDPGHDFWFGWAEDFTRRYNAKLESELNKRN